MQTVKPLTEQAGQGAEAMRPTFFRWAFEQLRAKTRCRVERSMTCLPLFNDPICRACYEGEIACSTVIPTCSESFLKKDSRQAGMTKEKSGETDAQ